MKRLGAQESGAEADVKEKGSMSSSLANLASAIERAADTQRPALFVERRKEPRLWCSDLVHVWGRHGGRWKRLGVAVLEDISPSGACIQLESPLQRGDAVRLKHDAWLVEGEVRYCNYRDEGYFVGIELTGSHKWSQEQFRPKHLTDPAKIAPRKQRPGSK